MENIRETARKGNRNLQPLYVGLDDKTHRRFMKYLSRLQEMSIGEITKAGIIRQWITDKLDEVAPVAKKGQKKMYGLNANEPDANQITVDEIDTDDDKAFEEQTSKIISKLADDAIKGSQPLSDAQIKRFHAIRNKAGIDYEAARAVMQRIYQKNSIKELTLREYDGLCRALKNMAETQD